MAGVARILSCDFGKKFNVKLRANLKFSDLEFYLDFVALKF
ncbi:hypothetical protein CAMGR0001_2639 [Campylobacter gracilis RM3268]|uniref:Uncharacterized protein n=1 Tax=Campylobacter gracilis RM3268 TaxID=553220 RepID=C8PEZ9_9BACT|nr:hypothetical protein CAMGR0001_2639 [Campylobacter gracilis RM3268]